MSCRPTLTIKMFLLMAGRPHKIPPQTLEIVKEYAERTAPATTKMSQHNAYYRLRAIRCLQRWRAALAAAGVCARLFCPPQKTILSELGRIEDPLQLIWQAVMVAHSWPSPVAPTVRKL